VANSLHRRNTLADLEYRYTAVYEPAEEGGYVVTVPALPGLVTEGDILEEARAMAEDAIRGYLESLRKHGEAIPVEQGEPIIERILVNLSGA
jgi:predicted RNase H-like HicB family nuclease